MFAFLMTFFVILCLFLALAILIQQGKGDMGLGGLGGGGQMLFGGSGGQELFEKITWIMGALFILGALCLTILKTKQIQESRISKYATFQQQKNKSIPKLPEKKESTQKGTKKKPV
ncbi:preprotein translocase subunit SecG [Candidatus Babeliales bacterium]|nr:preprotein translocase subunit SecG [Candidatus Babeliales bacterium]